MTTPKLLSALTLACAGLVWPSMAAAQALPLTLDEAVQRGVASSAKLKEIHAREEAAAASRDAREALNRPMVSALSSYVRTNHVDEYAIRQADGASRVLYPDIPDNLRVRAEMLWPVWTSGRVTALVAAATADQEAVAADARVAVADLTLEVTQAYWGLVTSRETVQVIKASLDRMDAWVSDVRARLEAGLVSPHELLMAQAQRAREQVQQIQADHAAVVAERELARLVGVPGQAIEPLSSVSQERDGIGGLTTRAAAEVVMLAHESRPERGAFSLRRDSFRAMAEAAMAATRPQVAALASFEPARPNSRFFPREARWHSSWDLGVSLTWALWDGGRAKADRAAAEAQVRALDARQEDFDSRVAVDVRARLDDIAAGRAAVAASTEAVGAATEAHRVLQERYSAGVATSTDVLDAQVALLEASLERTRLQAALRMSEARLQRAVGGL